MIIHNIDIVSEECCTCGVVFHISRNLQSNFKKYKKTFYCPNGHQQSYTKSLEEELREQIAMKDRQISGKNSEISTLENQVRILKRKKK